jgi:protein-S-isoprenylcysteine O-methyltransferase Ste14
VENQLLYYLLGSILLLVLGYFVFRRIVRNDYLKNGKLSHFSSFLEFLFFALHANFSYIFLPSKWPYLPSMPENIYQHIISLICVFIGLIGLIWSMIPLGFFRTMGLKSVHLKKNGLYRYSRNPQIIFYLLILIGVFISYPTFYSVGWIIIYLVVGHLMILTEEEYLQKKYKDNYRAYCKKVPRYIGFHKK